MLIIGALNQKYVIEISVIPGIAAGEIHHWDSLLNTAIANNLATLSSRQHFFIYNRENNQKLLTAIAVNGQ